MDEVTNIPEPTTQPHEAPSPSRSNYKILSLILGVALIGVLVGGVYLFLNTPPTKPESTSNTTTNSVDQSTKEEVIPTTVSVTPPTTKQEVTVIIESEATLPSQDVTELRTRVINPYIDYFSETKTGDEIKSFKISKNTQASAAEFPYLGDVITQNGVNEGFVISKSQGHISWWLPECMNGCTFSDAFKAKYPDLVKAYGN